MFRKLLAFVVFGCAAGSALADEVVLTSGEVLTVTDVVRADGRVRMHHAVLGQLDLPEAQVKEIRAAAAVAVAPAPSPAPPPPPPPPPVTVTVTPAPKAAPEPEAPKWKYRAELGVNGESGNVRSRDIRAAIDALYETPLDRWKFDAVWQRSKIDGVDTRRQWDVEGLKDWMFCDTPWFAFATARYDRDAFQEWDDRISAGVGVGYKLIDKKDLKVRARAGFNAVLERGVEHESWRPEALLGADANWTINDMQSIEASSTWYPDLKDGGEYRLLSKLAWVVKLSRTAALSLKVGLEDEYDSHREPPFKKNDLKYIASIVYEF